MISDGPSSGAVRACVTGDSRFPPQTLAWSRVLEYYKALVSKSRSLGLELRLRGAVKECMNSETQQGRMPSLAVRTGKRFNHLPGTEKTCELRYTKMTIKKEEMKNDAGGTSAVVTCGSPLPSAEAVSKRIADRLPPVRFSGPLVVPPRGAGI
jgi:hypothetical protein